MNMTGSTVRTGRRTLLTILAVCAFALPASAQVRSGSNDLILRELAGTAAKESAPLSLNTERSGLTRYAVVVGNADYAVAPDLPNAREDARDMAAFLRTHGFHVIERYNLDKRGFEELMQHVLVEFDGNAEVLFYFAGHGFQIGRRNYLVPVEATLASIYDAPFETITLDNVISILSARSRMQLMILDACRTNPFTDKRVLTEVDSTLFETREGFQSMSAPVNALLAYSTSPGAVALDGDGDNSPYTSALLNIANDDPSAVITNVLERVRRDVYEKTNGRQVPWESSTLVEPFAFSMTPDSGEVDASTAATVADVASRGLIVATNSTASSGPAGAGLAPFDVSSRLERRVVIGQLLAERFGADAALSVTGELTRGRLVTLAPDGSFLDYGGAPLSGDALSRLIYQLSPEQRPAQGPIGDYAVNEILTISDASGATAPLRLSMQPDQCDYLAGDHLDPDGVGLVRYPNEIDPDAALAACEASVAANPELGRFHYQLGRAQLALRDAEGARASFEAARDRGHTRAWYALGALAAKDEAIAGGLATTKIGDTAIRNYVQGVELGDPYAYHALGKQLLRFGETDAWRRRGFDLLSNAVELGHTFSMNELGVYYLKKDSSHYDPRRGLRYWIESAERDDIYGFKNLGDVNAYGMGEQPVNLADAMAWYRKASDGGHPTAPTALGRAHYNGGPGVEANVAEAIRWYDVGLARGDGWGGANAAWIIANKRPASYSPSDAAIRAARAAVLRNRDAAATAEKVLAALPEKELDRASQTLMTELGEPLTADGAFGNQSKQALDRLIAAEGYPPLDDSAVERLKYLAQLSWRRSGFRIDLY